MFEVNIPKTAFSKGYLKIVSSAKLSVNVLGETGEVLEAFTTNPSETKYQLDTPLNQFSQVVVTLYPGETVNFHPVVQAK